MSGIALTAAERAALLSLRQVPNPRDSTEESSLPTEPAAEPAPEADAPQHPEPPAIQEDPDGMEYSIQSVRAALTAVRSVGALLYRLRDVLETVRDGAVVPPHPSTEIPSTELRDAEAATAEAQVTDLRLRLGPHTLTGSATKARAILELLQP
jgi:hypothetical protein